MAMTLIGVRGRILATRVTFDTLSNANPAANNEHGAARA